MTRKAAPRFAKPSALGLDIISSVEKPIPAKELLVRLQKIADELSATEQTPETQSSFNALAEKLANRKLLKHKNIGVQAYTCCAIADIMRLCAPDSPFEADAVPDIFKAFFKQFSRLNDEDNPNFLQQCYILKRVVEVRSISLLCDHPSSASLISLMFDTFYSVAGRGFPASMEPLALELLAETISEADQIPQDVVTLVISKFANATENNLTRGASNISNPAFTFSLAVCEANADKMARQVAQLFSEMLDGSIRATAAGNVDYNASFEALVSVHQSATHIWTFTPELLSSVMGLIKDELNADSDRIRQLATKTIGQMLDSSARSNGDTSPVTFVTYHRETWQEWLKKSSDQSVLVRETWVKHVSPIIVAHTTSEMSSQLATGLSKCLIDVDETVRLASCEVFDLMPFEVFTSKVCTTTNLDSLHALTREKDVRIRNKAIGFLAHVYNDYMSLTAAKEVPDFGNRGNAEISKIESKITSEIPEKLLQLNYINDKQITSIVDVSFYEQILPFDDDANRRVTRLCSFYGSLGEKGKQAFMAINQRQKKVADAVLKFVTLAEDLHSREEKKDEPVSGVSRSDLVQKLEKIMQWLTMSLPDDIKAFDSLDAFLKLGNLRLISLWKNCVEPQLPYKVVKNSIKEILVKLNDLDKQKSRRSSSVANADLILTMKLLLYRSAILIYNRSNIEELLKNSTLPDEGLQLVSHEILSNISSTSPSVFDSHVQGLSNMIVESHINVRPSLLKSLYHVLKTSVKSFPDSHDFTSALHILATEGTCLQSRYSLKLLGCSMHKKILISDILDQIMPLSVDSPFFTSHLSAIAEIYAIDAATLTEYSDSINSVIVDEVLRKNRKTASSTSVNSMSKWISDEQAYADNILMEKIIALRLIVNRIKSIAQTEAITYTQTAAEKPIKLLANIIANSGEIVKSQALLAADATPECHRLRLQLSAGLGLLKLAQNNKVETLIDQEIMAKMSLLIFHDPIDVRNRFLKSICKRLTSRAISDRFLPLLFFYGHEPDDTTKKYVMTWLRSQQRRSKTTDDKMLEFSIPRLIYQIAKDTRFVKISNEEQMSDNSSGIESLLYALSYISMYISVVASVENIDMLYYLASRVKQYHANDVDVLVLESAELPNEVMNLYRVAELCQLMLKEWADSKSLGLNNWPGKADLPSDLFTMMPSFEIAQKFTQMIFIPDDIQFALRQALKKGKASQAKRKLLKVAKSGQNRKQDVKSNVTTAKSRKKRQDLKSEVATVKQGLKRPAGDEELTEIRGVRKSRRTTRGVKYKEDSDSENEGTAEPMGDSDDADASDVSDDYSSE